MVAVSEDARITQPSLAELADTPTPVIGRRKGETEYRLENGRRILSEEHFMLAFEVLLIKYEQPLQLVPTQTNVCGQRPKSSLDASDGGGEFSKSQKHLVFSHQR